MSLYGHQLSGVDWLVTKPSAMLLWEMGLGKTRAALLAATKLYAKQKIDRVLVLCPAAVKFSWRTEIEKLDATGTQFLPCIYDAKKQLVYGESRPGAPLPVLVLSYSLLPQKRHVEAIAKWCENGKSVLIADESSFLKNRTAKQTKGAARISRACCYRWLLTGTPIANSPLDLYGQAMVMFPNGVK